MFLRFSIKVWRLHVAAALVTLAFLAGTAEAQNRFPSTKSNGPAPKAVQPSAAALVKQGQQRLSAKEYTAFPANREAALKALESFQLGSTLTPPLLLEINNLVGAEPIEGADKAMSANAKELLAAERKRYAALEFEMVAAADMLLRAATMSPGERAARGLKLGWLFGPVSAPNSRTGSKDGLAGLRLIGRLELPQGKVINSIAAVRFYPPADMTADEEGKVALLSNLDNLRLEVKMFNQGTTKTDYAFQSFGVAGQGAKLTMRPGFYVDPKTGTLVSRELDAAGLGTSCINCHLSGPRVLKDGSANLALMAKADYPAMEGLAEFLDQVKHWNGGVSFRRKLEEKMKTLGPAGLLPLDDMLKANREHWVSIYPRFLARLQTPPQASPAVAASKVR